MSGFLVHLRRSGWPTWRCSHAILANTEHSSSHLRPSASVLIQLELRVSRREHAERSRPPWLTQSVVGEGSSQSCSVSRAERDDELCDSKVRCPQQHRHSTPACKDLQQRQLYLLRLIYTVQCKARPSRPVFRSRHGPTKPPYHCPMLDDPLPTATNHVHDQFAANRE